MLEAAHAAAAERAERAEREAEAIRAEALDCRRHDPGGGHRRPRGDPCCGERDAEEVAEEGASEAATWSMRRRLFASGC